MREKIRVDFHWLLLTTLVSLLLFDAAWLSAAENGHPKASPSKAASTKPWFSFKYHPAGHNFAGFPACSFTRPFGFKMKSFGHTAAAGNIDNNPEGSACPVGGLGAPGFEWTMSGNFRYWFLKYNLPN